ncbi:MAG: DNA polymerase I [Deltaproteobacteria bacterium]|nr:MAG: DNA polymerase I [Deltaproteobacteria bacterium]
MPAPIKRLFLIDGSSYIFRAFYAIRGLSTSKGFPTNAIFGFTSMLLKILKDHRPEAMAVVFDAKGPSFRSGIFREYKANRPPLSDDLSRQIPYIKEIVEAFRIPILEKEGYEADDLIGTVAKRARGEGIDVVIVSGDKDLLQLVDERVTQLDTMRDELYGPKEVEAKLGVKPSSIPDMMGLCGDPIDNIPGVPGIGKKTAQELIRRYGSLETLLERAEEDPGIRKRLKEAIRQNRQQALLSKQLATIDTQVPLEFRWEDFRLAPPDEERLKAIFRELEFHRFLKELFPERTLSEEGYHLVTEKEDLEALVRRLRKAEGFALDLESTSRDPMVAQLVGFAISLSPHEAYYIPVGHDYLGAPPQLPADEVLTRLKGVLEDEGIKKYGQNIKYDYIILGRYGVKLRGISCDAMVAAYLLDPTRRVYNLESLAQQFLGHQMITYKEVVGKGEGFQKVELEQAKRYACEDADVTFLLAGELLGRLGQEGLKGLFERVELPLIEVLAEMEMWGVRVDVGQLGEFSKELEGRLWRLEEEIQRMAGVRFNLNSPQQVGKVLFERLGLPVKKKTKTGYSTDVEVLQSLAREYEIARLLLEYRGLAKLKSTYVDALPKMINPETGRIHTSYNQTATATGRLSSSEPNLQNIPIRTEEGRRIREAFIPEEGWVLLGADYSQIELRILAHLSADPTLIEAFRREEDIHTRTACEVFGVGPDEVTPEMRREAKVINFGIIYGMSPYGLSKELGVEPKVAARYIEDYFKRYQGVKAFIEGVISEAKRKGYVTTLFGRRRPLPEINSSNRTARQFAERTAINTPVQGTAADLIKMAMVNIYRRIRKEGLQAKLIIQVHDELILEVKEEELERAKEMVKEEMEGVSELRVPLKVEISAGKNWGEIH